MHKSVTTVMNLVRYSQSVAGADYKEQQLKMGAISIRNYNFLPFGQNKK